ncbi:MAG: sigma-70 family RNA polymerase sigma factor [Clostridia bacterium]|nr:sigma-70 family RNA polymerase sigma factor [Clostridia bacterium]MBR5721839.1 sigma-70 family RNA polymerase sigma factor [Clostridia bacterium]
MTTGDKIKKYRTLNNMTQKQLAERLCVSADLVSKWECGNRRPDYSAVQELAGIFDIDPELLVESEDKVLDELGALFPAGLEKEAISDRINTFLGNCSDNERNIFVLRYSFFLDTKVIAEKLRLSDGNVRMILTRLRRKLKKHIRGSF